MSRVTFLMAVHNGMPYLPEAMESMLKQTVPCDILVVDDASSDGTADYLKGLDGKRGIRILTNRVNLGLADSLNLGISNIRTDYVARLDSDDVARCDRIERQLDFMDAHPDVGILGGYARIFGNPSSAGTEFFPVGIDCIRAYLLFANPLCHPTVMIRRGLLTDHQLAYRSQYGRSEDLDLWIRMSRVTRLENLPRILTDKRDHPQTVTSVHSRDMADQAGELHAALLGEIGLSVSPADLERHGRVGLGKRVVAWAELNACGNWLENIYFAAQRSGLYSPAGLKQAMGMIWWRLCANSTPLGWAVWRAYAGSEWGREFSPSFAARTRFFLSVLWHMSRSKSCSQKRGNS